MAALNYSNCSFGHGLLRARPSDDHKDSRLPSERTEFSGECKSKVSRIHRQSPPDNTRGILDTEPERRRRFLQDRYYVRRVGSRMDRVLPGKNLPGSLSLYDKGIPQSSYGTIYRRDSKTFCDVWSRIFCEWISSAAH